MSFGGKHIGWNLRAEWHVGSNGFTIWLIMFLHMISSWLFQKRSLVFLIQINNAVSIASKWTQKSSNIKNMLCHPNTIGIIMNIPGTQMVFGHGHWPIRIMLWNCRPLQMGSLSCPYHGPSQHHPVGLKRSDLCQDATVHRPEMTRSQRGISYILTVEICRIQQLVNQPSVDIYDLPISFPGAVDDRWLSMQSQTSPWKPWSTYANCKMLDLHVPFLVPKA